MILKRKIKVFKKFNINELALIYCVIDFFICHLEQNNLISVTDKGIVYTSDIPIERIHKVNRKLIEDLNYLLKVINAYIKDPNSPLADIAMNKIENAKKSIIDKKEWNNVAYIFLGIGLFYEYLKSPKRKLVTIHPDRYKKMLDEILNDEKVKFGYLSKTTLNSLIIGEELFKAFHL
jgi:hypothetical protein